MADYSTRDSFYATAKPWQDLACAIVLQSAKDYSAYLEKRKKHPCSKFVLDQIRELEDFFRSDFYEMLTSIDPDLLMAALKSRSMQKKG